MPPIKELRARSILEYKETYRLFYGYRVVEIRTIYYLKSTIGLSKTGMRNIPANAMKLTLGGVNFDERTPPIKSNTVTQ